MVVRLALTVLWIAVLLNLVTGILFWTGHADPLQDFHILLGVIAVLDLWALAIFQGLKGGGFDLVLVALVVGLLLAVVGRLQTDWLPGGAHWIIQVIHLLLGLMVLGVGQRISGRARRVSAKTAA